MHHLDVAKGVSLRHKETGGHVDVLQVEQGKAYLGWWERGEHEWLALDRVYEEFETLVQSDGLPLLAVEPVAVDAAGVAQGVRIVVVAPHPAFVDDNEPLTLRASLLGRPVLDAYVAAVVAGEAWLDRESGADMSLQESPLALQAGLSVVLSSEVCRERYPSHWFSVMVGANEGSEPFLKVTLRDEALATAIFEAVASGSLVMERS